MAHALSVSAMHSSGLWEYLFSQGEFKRAHPGMAAHGGIRSALLARLGMTGPLSVLEGEKGFLNAFSNAPDPVYILDGLGSNFQVLRIGFKPYSSCRLTHSSIDAATHLKHKYGINPDLIDKVTVSTCTAMAKLNNQHPTDTFSGQFSIPFSVALALANGSNMLKDYALENVQRKDLLELTGKVEVVSDPSMDPVYPEIIGARATIRMKDGKEVTEYVKFPTGEPENPMSEQALKDKFRSLISTMLSSEQARRIEDAVDHLEKIGSIRELTNLIFPSESS
jgi:2-methylcitrate dehydratase PrpD